MKTTERDCRVQLAACYRIFDLLGWTELIYNHITLRVPGDKPEFLINPFGLHYSEVTASNLVKVDLDGNILGESDYPVNPAGFVLHSAIHSGVKGAHCVMHTHTTTGCAVATSRNGLSHNNFYSAMLEDRVAYHDFEGITVYSDEGPRVVESINGRNAVILRNHGLLSWGENISQAFAYLWTLQRACDIQVAGSGLGAESEIHPDIRQKCSKDALQFNANSGGSKDVYEALIRQIDRIDPSYRD